MRKSIFLSLIISFLFSFALIGQQLEIHHLNVGQGDATLIISPTGKKMLIDAGDTGKGNNVVRPYLTSLGITSLDYVVCSHYHADHLGGLDEVINGMGASNIGSVYDRGSDAPLPSTVAFNDYVSAANSTGRRYKVALGQVLDLGGGVTMKCVATDGEVINYGVVPGASGSENDLSVGWLLNYNSFQYFTGGDLGGETTYYADNETPLAPQVGNVDAFKINHHGSQYSTNQTWVNALQAETGIIPVGTNSYGHPTQIVLDRLANANCYIYQIATGSGGTIPSGKGVIANNHVILKTSGSTYTVSYGTTTHNYPGDGGSGDVTPPVISNVAASSITTNSAVITWTTDEPSNSVVDYGLTTSYGSTTSDPTMVTSHSVTLTGLSANTVYNYRVKSTDGSGNTRTDVNHSFRTGASYTYVASGTTITSGSLNSGTYANLATNNASYYVVNSTTSGTRVCDWYGSVTISQAPGTVSKLTITYDGKNSASKTQILYLYNWTSSTWTQIDSRTVGTSDVTITKTQTSPANFISGTGQIRLRVYSTGGTKNYTCSGDFMQFVVETSGSVISKQGSPLTGENLPSSYLLHQNYPNPFNPSTIINYQLSIDNYVTLKVYDVLGQEVAVLVDGFEDAGYKSVEFNAASASGGLPSGIYFYRLVVSSTEPLTAGNYTDVKKMMLLK